MLEHLDWIYVNDAAVESETLIKARELSVEHGIEPITATIGAQYAIAAASTQAVNIIEIGTGFGVSGLWLLSGAPHATLTSIDDEYDHHEQSKPLFLEAGYLANRVRLITGRAADVLPRMNENDYDVAVIDGDPNQLLFNVEHALRLVRVGGVVLIPHALWNGEVAEPAKRGAVPSALRAIMKNATDDENQVWSLASIGDGLLQIVKTA
jgi:predicted O-methyltransferase YrrM